MKDAKLEDKEETPFLSPSCLESQNIILPNDIFKNRLTWSCYESYKSLAFRLYLISLLLWLPIIVWWRMFSIWIYSFIAAFLGLLFLVAIQMICRKRAISQQLTQFSKEVIANSPGTEVKDWEPIAASLNSFMYENKFWKTKFLFYAGWDCQEAFRTTLLQPFSLKKDGDARAKSFKDSVPYIEQALEVYFAEVDKQWRLINNKKAPILNDLRGVQLPKEIYRLKLIWSLSDIHNWDGSAWMFASYNDPIEHSWWFFLGFFLNLMILLSSMQDRRVTSLRIKDKMHYLSIIISEQEVGPDRWKVIAKRMNRYVFLQKVWDNEDFFFDEIDCQQFFKHNLFDLLSSKNFVWTKQLNVELWPYIKEVQLSNNHEPLV